MTQAHNLIAPRKLPKKGESMNEDQIIASQNFQQTLNTLGERWKSQRVGDLTLRHETGVFLNTQNGDPTERQRYGKKVMELVAEKIEIDVSELNRMRWFAFRFKSVCDLQAKHPEITSWTKLRALLAVLAAKDRKQNQETDQPDKGRSFSSLCRTLKALPERFRKLEIELTEKEREKLEKIIAALAEAIEASTGVGNTVTLNRLKAAS
jgi:DNA repair exonuclease SbcCD nuclease subunit